MTHFLQHHSRQSSSSIPLPLPHAVAKYVSDTIYDHVSFLLVRIMFPYLVKSKIPINAFYVQVYNKVLYRAVRSMFQVSLKFH